MDISNQQPFLAVKDYSVSQEIFDLYYDAKLDMLITSPQPSLENLGKYYESVDYISHTDSKRSLFEKAYHVVKTIALKNKLNLINSLQPNNGSLLDIGAGTGDFLSVAKENGWHTIGVEPSENDCKKERSIICWRNQRIGKSFFRCDFDVACFGTRSQFGKPNHRTKAIIKTKRYSNNCGSQF